MNLKKYVDKKIIKKEPTSKEEISDLLKMVERDIRISGEVSDLDWSFGIVYNAALKLANILLRASGYRTSGQGHHMNAFLLVPEFLGQDRKDDADYLDSCRRKRNIVEYDRVGAVSQTDVEEIREFVKEFQSDVMEWLKENYSELL